MIAAFETNMEAFCVAVFYPILRVFFDPINTFLSNYYQPYATIVAIVFFVGTMAWVGFIMSESYVNEGRFLKRWYTDLRLWTVISMVPHLFVYYYFR